MDHLRHPPAGKSVHREGGTARVSGFGPDPGHDPDTHWVQLPAASAKGREQLNLKDLRQRQIDRAKYYKGMMVDTGNDDTYYIAFCLLLNYYCLPCTFACLLNLFPFQSLNITMPQSSENREQERTL